MEGFTIVAEIFRTNFEVYECERTKIAFWSGKLEFRIEKIDFSNRLMVEEKELSLVPHLRSPYRKVEEKLPKKVVEQVVEKFEQVFFFLTLIFSSPLFE